MASTTNPADWFLPNVPYTDGNLVNPLIDGAAYYKNLKDTVSANSGFSNILISGWRLRKDTIIDNSDGLTFEGLLSGRVNDFSKIKSMLWYVPGSIGDFGAIHGPENIAFTEFIIDNGGRAIMDNRLPDGRFASHHQKYMVIDGDSTKAAFIGGIDIAPDRLDTPDHDNSVPRMEEYFKAWHDIQVKLEGPVVTEAFRCFQERWNDTRKPHDYPTAGGEVPPPLDDSEIPAITDSAGNHSVQLLRTYACRSNDGEGGQSSYPFAVGGKYDYQNALIKAIETAEHYIYIEDQYFWPGDITDALADAVSRGIAVILVLARDYDTPGITPYHNFLRNMAIEKMVTLQGEQNLVFVYHLEQSAVNPGSQTREQIYVHSKTMIVDDRYFVIGSGNLNRRSMKTDTELGAAVVDKTSVSSSIKGTQQEVGELARAYRKNLWSEHLRQNVPDDPFDGDGHPSGFPKDDRLVGHVKRHEVPQPRFCNLSIIPFGFLNPNTSC